MSEENKCNGLDCAICAETKCPNEKPIINGIDVSESVLTATNNDVYYSQKAVDELQNVIKRLQEENKKLKNKNNDLIEEIASGNIDIAILQKENKKLKADLEGETEQCQKWYQLETDKHFQMLKYEQALEKIRKEYTNSIFYQCDKTEEECPCHNCIILGQLDRVQSIIKKINEVLNDRD